MKPSLLEQLGGGDRRSIGNSNRIVADVLKHPNTFDALFDAMLYDDPLIRMRAADAVEKITAAEPGLLQPRKREFLHQLIKVPQQEVRWHVCQMLPRLDLTRAERQRAFGTVKSFLADTSAIARTCALQTLADLASQDLALVPQTLPILEQASASGTPAMRARGRKLLKALSKKSGG